VLNLKDIPRTSGYASCKHGYFLWTLDGGIGADFAQKNWTRTLHPLSSKSIEKQNKKTEQNKKDFLWNKNSQNKCSRCQKLFKKKVILKSNTLYESCYGFQDEFIKSTTEKY